MTNRFVATLAAAAIALAGVTAAPAQAGNLSNFEKFVLGAGALVIFGAAVNSHNQNRGRTVVRRHNPPTVYRHRNTRTVPAWCVHGRGHNQWVDWGCVRRAGY